MTPQERAELKRKIDAAVRARHPKLKRGRPARSQKKGVK